MELAAQSEDACCKRGAKVDKKGRSNSSLSALLPIVYPTRTAEGAFVRTRTYHETLALSKFP
jgi:hypothetical protein